MTLTSTEAAELLGMTTADSRYARVTYLLPLITDQINQYCNGGFSHQVKEEQVSLTAAGTSGSTALDHQNIVRGSLYVTSTNRGTLYFGDCMFIDFPHPEFVIPSTEIEEYVVDYENGYIWAASTQGHLIPSTNALVTYAYVDLIGGGKEAAARMISASMMNSAGIAAESVGPLARSYSAGGIDELTRALLTPYRRPAFR